MSHVWSMKWRPSVYDSVLNTEYTDSLNLEQTYILEWWLCSESAHKKREYVYQNMWPSDMDSVSR